MHLLETIFRDEFIYICNFCEYSWQQNGETTVYVVKNQHTVSPLFQCNSVAYKQFPMSVFVMQLVNPPPPSSD